VGTRRVFEQVSGPKAGSVFEPFSRPPPATQTVGQKERIGN